MTLIRPASAVEHAEAAARAVQLEADHASRRWPQLAGFASALVNRGPMPPMPTGLSSIAQGTLHGTAQAQAAMILWHRHRIVYTIDSDLAVELGDTDPDDTIPAGLVHQLPHPDPYLALPEAIILPIAGTDETTHYHGAFLYSADRKGHLRSTADPDAHRLDLVLPGFVHGSDGEPLRSTITGAADMVWTRTSIDTGDGPARMATVIASAIDRFVDGSRGRIEGMPEAVLTVTHLLMRVTPMVVYVCAANAERRVAPARAVTRRRGRRASADRLPTVVEHGFHLGPALAAARRAQPEGPVTAGEPTGRHMRAHVRRAHWHTYRVGPGRAQSVVHWLPPIPINGEASKATVIPVRDASRVDTATRVCL